MLVATYFLSVYQVQKLAGRSEAIVVSVRDRHYTPKLQAGFRDVLLLYFDDHDDARDGPDATADPFSTEHAQKLRTWLAPYIASNEKFVLLCHCRAGLSRSASLSFWANQELGVPLRTTFPTYYLNRHVLTVLNPSISPPVVPPGKSRIPDEDVERFFNEDDIWADIDGKNSS